MIPFNDLPYDTLVPINIGFNTNGLNHRIYIIKTFCSGDKKDVYYLKDYVIINGEMVCLGYIYFYINFIRKRSKFIGVSIRQEYRSMGLASLLVSNWIKLCLDNGIENLDTIKKQRKPFLIYLLKTYSFELQNTGLYDTDRKNIAIYRNSSNSLKYLLFRDKDFQRKFSESAIMDFDNYNILENPSDDFIHLDNVLLGRRYDMQDDSFAYTKSIKTIERHKL